MGRGNKKRQGNNNIHEKCGLNSGGQIVACRTFKETFLFLGGEGSGGGRGADLCGFDREK